MNMAKNSSTGANSTQRKNNIYEKAKLMATFDSAAKTLEIFVAVENMKHSSLFDVSELSLVCWKMAQKLILLGHHDEKLGVGSKQRKLKGKAAHFRQAFACANSADEMLIAFRKMEPHFQEKELGYDCWTLAMKLYEQRQDAENTLCYGKRALQFLLDYDHTGIHKLYLMIPSILNVLGYASCKLEHYGESLAYLNWSERNLSILESFNSCPDGQLYHCLRTTHYELAIVKTAQEKEKEISIHVRKILEIQEKVKVVCTIDEVIENIEHGLKGLGLREQGKVARAIRLLRKVKRSAGGGDSAKKN